MWLWYDDRGHDNRIYNDLEKKKKSKSSEEEGEDRHFASSKVPRTRRNVGGKKGGGKIDILSDH